MDIKEMLRQVQSGVMTIEAAEAELKDLPYKDLGYAKLDYHRKLRSGFPETVFCQGKPDEYLGKIFQELYERNGEVMGTRADERQYQLVKEVLPEAVYDPISRIIQARKGEAKREGCVAVLTGGTGYGEEISEAQCMYDYLTEYGVEADRLILEDRASNTAENFAFSWELLTEAGVDPAEGRVAVVTNDFHIARSELIAAREGYGDVAGIPAPLPWVHLEINYTLREAFAMVKTFLFD